MLALALESVMKPKQLPALYQTKPPNAGIMLTPVTRLAAKTKTVDTGSTFRAGSNTLGFAKYFVSGTGEDNASTEMTVVSTSDFRPRAGISRGRQPAGITSTIGALESG